MSSAQTIATGDLDIWINTLMKCKPLAENDVKKLCEKVDFD
jgi:hypothetical protein